jgi:hypothetical protein
MPIIAREKRSLELRLAAVAVGTVAVFTAFVFILDSVSGSFRLPTLPRMHGLEAFELYSWIGPLGWFVVLLMVPAVLVRWIIGWRGATAWIGPAIPLVVCVMTAMLYVPFRYVNERRVDRVVGQVEKPVVAMQAIADSVVAVCVLAGVFLCVVRMRRTPAVTRYAGLAVAATLTAVLPSIVWILLVAPAQNRWAPIEWRTDLLVPFRPCRGALLWKVLTSTDGGGLRTHPYARIDDLWLEFRDPRTPGAPVWALSAAGEWKTRYVWLTRAEAATLRVRRDDPMVVRCDAGARAEPIAPSAWHQVGLDR